MAYSLRTRLGRRIANATKKSAATESDEPSFRLDELSGDVASKLDLNDQGEQLPTEDPGPDTTLPSPEHKLRSTKDSRDTTPPQSLLNRYKSRDAKASVKTVKTTATPSAGKKTSFNEDFNDDSGTSSSEWVDVTGASEADSDKYVKVQDGLEFEMMGSKGQASEAPITQDEEDFVYERRSTRSQTRRQQRADSVDSTMSSNETKDKEITTVPQPLTVKKVSEQESTRTPYPPTEFVAPTPSNTPGARNKPPPNTLMLDQSNGKAEYRLSTSPDPISSEKTVTQGLRRKLPLPPVNENAPPTTVTPPIYTNTVRAEQIWTSPLASTSRPEMPWGWLKTWTCCRCAHLDPNKRDRPAETMVEQKVCSRLACGHVRCASGCRMMRDSRFDV